MVTLVRPRHAALMLSLDAGGNPRASDLTLTTRAGEVVWRGEVGPDAWQAGLRLRGRCQGTWQDAHWVMTRVLLEAELASHGLGRDCGPDLDVQIVSGRDGVTLTTTCRVIPGVALGARPAQPSLDAWASSHRELSLA